MSWLWEALTAFEVKHQTQKVVVICAVLQTRQVYTDTLRGIPKMVNNRHVSLGHITHLSGSGYTTEAALWRYASYPRLALVALLEG